LSIRTPRPAKAGEEGFPIVGAGDRSFEDQPMRVRHRNTTAGYLRTIGVNVTQGRDFQASDFEALQEKSLSMRLRLGSYGRARIPSANSL
jgi:hypothetical protein